MSSQPVEELQLKGFLRLLCGLDLLRNFGFSSRARIDPRRAEKQNARESGARDPNGRVENSGESLCAEIEATNCYVTMKVDCCCVQTRRFTI